MPLTHPCHPSFPFLLLCCSLILINEQIYGQLKQQIVGSQMPDRQQHLAACLEKLMLVRLPLFWTLCCTVLCCAASAI